jgi:hypothetical protein
MRKSALEPTPASGDPVTILDMQEPARDPNLPQNEKTDLLEVEESPVGESGGDYEDSFVPPQRTICHFADCNLIKDRTLMYVRVCLLQMRISPVIHFAPGSSVFSGLWSCVG